MIRSDLWRKTPAILSLSPNYIDIWSCHLPELGKDITTFYHLLTADERERADRLRVEKKQQQFILTRGYLRQRLGWLTGMAPEDLLFDYLEHGKPILAKQQKYIDITFNISHADELALVAISQRHSIGIDIEKIDRQLDYCPLVGRFLSPAEQVELNSLPPSVRVRAFFATWTRKEAFIKATGDGISYGLGNFDVSVDPDLGAPKIKPRKGDPAIWTALDLPVDDDYSGCVVSDMVNINTRYWY